LTVSGGKVNRIYATTQFKSFVIHITLRDAIRLKRACNICTDFHLNCRVADGEAVVEFLGKFDEKLVARMAGRHQAVARQSGFRRAHRPNVQVMNCGYARLSLQKLGDIG
jgi:hypothetical protein